MYMKGKAKEHVEKETNVGDKSNTIESNLINITQQECDETWGEKVKHTMHNV